MKKVVGVLYDTAKSLTSQPSVMEIVECGGESVVASVFSKTNGVVDISGHSAEPMALDGQFLIIGQAVTLKDAEKVLDGRPVIVEASDNDRYFKRLRVDANNVILESLEIGGNFPPILLDKSPGLLPHVTRIWPVLGVIFEKP